MSRLRLPVRAQYFCSPLTATLGDLNLHRTLLLLALAFTAIVSPAKGETMASAHYTAPVDRYGHFALGQPHEYARLTVTTDSGRRVELQLPDNEVFEDLKPRLVKLAAGDPLEVLAIVSRREDGSRLVMIRLSGGALEVSAQSPAIGTPNRWLNPVGIGDLDGDGRAEVVVVTTPHISGTLRIYRRDREDLVEIAALSGFSNHVYGTPELGLSTLVFSGGRMLLVVPDALRQSLRIAALEGGRLVEVGRCVLPAQVTGATRVVSTYEISVGLATGRRRIVLDDCLAHRSAGTGKE